MELSTKLIVLVLTAAALISLVVLLDQKIDRLTDLRWRLLARSLVYAVAFTPTAYHYAPNTIIAPLHLSTLGGNLFYGHDYTFGMFAYGVAIPLACGWALITIVLLFRQLRRSETIF